MRKALKIFGYTFTLLLVLVVLLIFIAKLSENRITRIALRKVSQNIEAPVAIQDVSFSLLRKFPLASIELKNVSLCGLTDTSCNLTPDTLMQVDRIYVAVKSKLLIKGIFNVMKVDIKGGMINYQVDTNGVSNIDFLIPSEEPESNDTVPGKPLNVTLKELKIKDVTCYYQDSLQQIAAKIKIPELEINGSLAGEVIKGSAKGQVHLSECSLAKTRLNLMQSAKFNFDADYNNDSLSIRSLLVDTDGARLAMRGDVHLGETITTDLILNRAELGVSELTKYLPERFLYDMGLSKVSGLIQIGGTVKGRYSESEMPRVDMSLTYKDGMVHMHDYPAINNLRFKGKISNGFLQNNQTTRVDFSRLAFDTEKSSFDIAFSLLDLDQPKYDIKTHMQVDLEEFRNYIPDSLVQHIDGKVKLALTSKGVVPDTVNENFADYLLKTTEASIQLDDVSVMPDSSLSVNNLSANIQYKPGIFNIKGLEMSVPAYHVTLENSSLSSRFEGSVNRLPELTVFLDQYQLNTKRSRISGNLKVQNLSHPNYAIDSRIELNLAEVKRMLPDSLVSNMTGAMDAHIRSAGRINPDSLDNELMDRLFTKGAYALDLYNVSATLPEYPDYTLENLSGRITMDSTAIRANNISGLAAGIQFGFDSTVIKNLYATMIQNKPEQLEVDTRISMGDLDYDRVMALIPTDTVSAHENSEVTEKEATEEVEEAEPINYTYLFKGKASVESFKYGSAHLKNISTLFNMQDSVYVVDQMKFDAFEGSFNTSAKYILKPDSRAIVQMRNSIKNVDINKLLADFNDFEEYYEPAIRSENLSGLLTCDFFTRADLFDGSLAQNSMRVRGDFQLEEGGVYDFEPATSLSDKTHLNELENIQFKNISSKVFIMKGAIYVPKTYISSTALDITAYGMQGFGEDYEYHLKLHLSDILLGKSDKLLKEQAKKGDIAGKDERKKAAYMVSYSLDGKAKTGFDNKNLQSTMKTKIRLQEKLLNLRFHPEMFKFDTGVYQNQIETRNKEKDI